MTDLDLAPIKNRLAKATPGPWDAYSVPGFKSEAPYTAVGIGEKEARLVRFDGAWPDADFIANSPTDIAALVAEVERLRTQIDAAREHHIPVDVNLYAATVKECCVCPGPWPCPTIKALGGEQG